MTAAKAAKAAILDRIRAALADRPQPAPVERSYRTAGTVAVELDRFAERLRDYRAVVHEIAPSEIAATIEQVLAGHHATRIGVPPGLDVALVQGALRGPFDVAALDELDGVVTACTLGIVETATIVLDHDAPDQGPRALTLVPDLHVLIVRAEQVVAGVPDAIAALAGVRTQTWISGPSATSDIELERVEGVHGPRRLEVLLVRN